MKKNYIFKFLLLMIPVSAFLLMSSSGGRDDARTGSPGDGGVTCMSCHTGGTSGTSVNITTNIPSAGYELNKEYDITVSLNSSTSTSGFQLTAEETTNDTKVGSFTAGTGSRVTGQRITHSGTDLKTWSFTWTSPSTDKGIIRFYTAAVAADGNGSNGSGDKTVTSSTSGDGVLGVSEAKRLRFDMYPNPASETLTIQLPSGSEIASVEFYDYLGRLALTEKISQTNNNIDVQSLSTGVYILRVFADDKIGAEKFIKK